MVDALPYRPAGTDGLRYPVGTGGLWYPSETCLMTVVSRKFRDNSVEFSFACLGLIQLVEVKDKGALKLQKRACQLPI